LLPDGARFYGHVESVHMATYRRPASMKLQFDTLVLPHGERFPIVAIPINPNDPHLHRGTNGRLVADYRPGDSAGYTVGGAAAGLLVGGIVHRPILGAFLGAIVGSIAGHENARENRDLIVSKGEHMVAIFETDLNTAMPPVLPPPPLAVGGWHATEGMHHGAPAAISGTIDVRDQDHPLTFDPAHGPYRDGDEVLVPLDRAAEQFQVDVTRHSDGRLTLEGPNGSIEINRDSGAFKTDGGQTGTLNHPLVDRDGVLYLPIEVFASISSDRIAVNGNLVHW
jgi:hypothetical protein